MIRNQFQIYLDKFNTENPDLDTKLAELTTSIAKQKKNLKATKDKHYQIVIVPMNRLL